MIKQLTCGVYLFWLRVSISNDFGLSGGILSSFMFVYLRIASTDLVGMFCPERLPEIDKHSTFTTLN